MGNALQYSVSYGIKCKRGKTQRVLRKPEAGLTLVQYWRWLFEKAEDRLSRLEVACSEDNQTTRRTAKEMLIRFARSSNARGEKMGGAWT